MNRSEIVAADKRFVWHPYTQMDRYLREDPMVIVAAEGPYLVDADGARYLDANGSWWVSTLGHRHPRLVKALTRQAETLPHVSLAGCTHEAAAVLAGELVALAPGRDQPALPEAKRLGKVFFSDNGSTAVESALKMAAQYWAQKGQSQRKRFVSVRAAFHGETVGATSVGGVDAFREVFAPLLFDVVHLPSPAERGGWEEAVRVLESLLESQRKEIAAVIVEPLLQGAGGMFVQPPEFLRRVREATRTADVLLIADEVFTGFGRTGTWFACDQAQVVPDLLCVAKALSGGLLPFAATLATHEIFDGFRGEKARAFFYGHSYSGNPLGAAVAREVLAVYRDEDVLGQVARKAPRIASRFHSMAQIAGATRPRCIGMVGALDLSEGSYFGEAGWKVYAAARRRGLYLRPLGDTVYIAPALNIPDDALEALLDGVEASLREVLLG